MRESFGIRLKPQNRKTVEEVMQAFQLDNVNQTINFIIASFESTFWRDRQKALEQIRLLKNAYRIRYDELKK
jgi:hypothetical protein